MKTIRALMMADFSKKEIQQMQEFCDFLNCMSPSRRKTIFKMMAEYDGNDKIKQDEKEY
jgi:hypothetical protein